MGAHVELPVERRRVDVEWHAFAAGAKPAVRLALAPGDADEVASRYAELGASTARTATITFQGAPAVLVYAARTADDAEALRDLEARILARAPDRHALMRELGRRLGYPPCCAAAFVARSRRDTSWRRLLFGRTVDTFQAARDGWVAKPRPRLDDLLRREGRALVSFQPCRYDCEHALEVADRIAEVVRGVDAGWLAWVEGELARPIAVAANGARAFVDLDEEPVRRIVRATAPVDPGGRSLAPDVDLARRLAGRSVGERGRIGGLGARAPVVLLDFRR